jgi:hypothetical protein
VRYKICANCRNVENYGPKAQSIKAQIHQSTINQEAVPYNCAKFILCPFAVYYLRYAVTSFFTLSRISLADGKRAGQKVQRKIAAAVQNVKRLYFLSCSFEISETNGQRSFFLP